MAQIPKTVPIDTAKPQPCQITKTMAHVMMTQVRPQFEVAGLEALQTAAGVHCP